MKIDGSSLSILNQMNKTQKKLSNTMQQLSTGKRVNSAKDDPSALALAQNLEKSIRSLDTTNQGISMTQGALETASGGLNATMDSLQRLRDLAVQASNGTLSSSDRANLQTEYDQQVQNIDQIASQTNFNGTKLLDGSFNQSVSTGEGGTTTSVSLDSTSSASLGVSATGVADQSSAEDALRAIDSAIAQVQSQQSTVGATHNGLEYSSNANAVQAENLAAAKSEAVDANYAELAAKLKEQQVQLQAQMAASKAQKKNEENYSKSILKS